MKKEKKSVSAGGKCLAPKGVILYFEGLDCSGKSSTGGLVQAALEQSGYEVGMRQYNRPPTAEQRARPWMDRFEVPGQSSLIDLSPNDGEDNEHIGLVWDRGKLHSSGEDLICFSTHSNLYNLIGPAGDFVYGNLNELSPADKKKRYEEFIAFDKQVSEVVIMKKVCVHLHD